MIQQLRAIALVLCVASMAGCATPYVNASSEMNPPPTERFSHFDRFEVEPITMGAPYAGQEANEAALKKIQENLDLRLHPVVADWNASEPANAPARVLRIVPHVRDIRFISGASRVFGGVLAGRSAVVLDVDFIDVQTGTTIASPEFYAHSNGWAGAYSFGVADNIMLIRPGTLITEYVEANYEALVGGRTGAEET